ncbi:MAG: hypothetical protein IME99_06710 [Proteobacteria bacterium]|nr:hypothetical protein [Pseudomonadota bacterium]
MKNIKRSIAATLFTLVVGVGSAHAVDILNTPGEVNERGVEWTQPEMTLSGNGKLKSSGVEYRGEISCSVTVAALRDRHNKVKIENEDGTIDIKAKSNTATVTLSGCTVTGSEGTVNELDSPIVFSNGDVKVKIKGFDTGIDTGYTFDKIKIKARYDKREGRRHGRHGKRDRTALEVKLYDGTITSLVVPEVTPQVVEPTVDTTNALGDQAGPVGLTPR